MSTDYRAVRQAITSRLRKARDNAIWRQEEPDATTIGRNVWRGIEYNANRGDDGACTARTIIGGERCAVWSGDICRAPKVPVTVGYNGEIISRLTSERFSIPKRDEAGRPNGGSTYPMWVTIPRDEVFALLARLEGKKDSLGQTIAAVRKGATLLQLWPAAASVMDACALAGLDWRDYLGDADAI